MTDPVASAAAATGVRLSVTPEGARRRPAGILDRGALLVGERWSHACARIFRILEGAGHGGASTTVAAVRDAEMPKLAAEYLLEFKLYNFLRHRDHESNKYRGLTEPEAARKFMRIVEDICDRSTGRLGGWWVK